MVTDQSIPVFEKFSSEEVRDIHVTSANHKTSFKQWLHPHLDSRRQRSEAMIISKISDHETCKSVINSLNELRHSSIRHNQFYIYAPAWSTLHHSSKHPDVEIASESDVSDVVATTDDAADSATTTVHSEINSTQTNTAMDSNNSMPSALAPIRNDLVERKEALIDTVEDEDKVSSAILPSPAANNVFDFISKLVNALKSSGVELSDNYNLALRGSAGASSSVNHIQTDQTSRVPVETLLAPSPSSGLAIHLTNNFGFDSAVGTDAQKNIYQIVQNEVVMAKTRIEESLNIAEQAAKDNGDDPLMARTKALIDIVGSECQTLIDAKKTEVAGLAVSSLIALYPGAREALSKISSRTVPQHIAQGHTSEDLRRLNDFVLTAIDKQKDDKINEANSKRLERIETLLEQRQTEERQFEQRLLDAVSNRISALLNRENEARASPSPDDDVHERCDDDDLADNNDQYSQIDPAVEPVLFSSAVTQLRDEAAITSAANVVEPRFEQQSNPLPEDLSSVNITNPSLLADMDIILSSPFINNDSFHDHFGPVTVEDGSESSLGEL